MQEVIIKTPVENQEAGKYTVKYLWRELRFSGPYHDGAYSFQLEVMREYDNGRMRTAFESISIPKEQAEQIVECIRPALVHIGHDRDYGVIGTFPQVLSCTGETPSKEGDVISDKLNECTCPQCFYLWHHKESVCCGGKGPRK